ncbi:MAG: SLC13 family permease [Thermoplasmata archaeon]
MLVPAAVVVFGILAVGVALFVWQKLRYDLVAVLMLLALGLSGVIPFTGLFLGFASSAVITIVSSLVLARALVNSGVLFGIARGLHRLRYGPTLSFALLIAITAGLSGFVSDVATFTILLPVGLTLGKKYGLPPSKFLIPMAAGAIAGGSLTLIGTSSNIVLGSIVQSSTGLSLNIFAFTPIGAVIVLAVVLLFVAVGLRFLPSRQGPVGSGDRELLPAYTLELIVGGGSKWAGRSIGEFEREYGEEVTVERIVRGPVEWATPRSDSLLQSGDRLILRSRAENLTELLQGSGLDRVPSPAEGAETPSRPLAEPLGPMATVEVVVTSSSPLVGNAARELALRDRYHAQLIGIARQGAFLTRRVAETPIRSGDVLLLQLAERRTEEVFRALRVLPTGVTPAGVEGGRPLLVVGIWVASIAIAAVGLLPVDISLALGAVATLLSGSLSPKEAYSAVHWPVVILTGCLIPFGTAVTQSGAAGQIASALLSTGLRSPWAVLAVLLVVTLLMANIIPNVAAVVVMAPVGLAFGSILSIHPLPLLMAIGYGATLPYLTPVGHPVNLLSLDIAGYRFQDFLRFGLPLTIISVVAMILLIPVVFPF